MGWQSPVKGGMKVRDCPATHGASDERSGPPTAVGRVRRRFSGETSGNKVSWIRGIRTLKSDEAGWLAGTDAANQPYNGWPN
jgi:hypothetical protein